MVETTYTAPPRVASFQRIAMVVGVAGLALCAAGFAADREQFFKSYLLAYMFWIGIALGSLALSMVHHLSGGAWGVVIRRVLEAASRTLPFMALLFLPIALRRCTSSYIWTNADTVAHDVILQHKAPYLNVTVLPRARGPLLRRSGRRWRCCSRSGHWSRSAKENTASR